MTLTKQGDYFVCVNLPYEHRYIAQKANFQWHKAGSVWRTADPAVALRLIAYADGPTRQHLNSEIKFINAAAEASRAESSDIEVPVPEGLSYFPFQLAGIAYVLKKFGLLKEKEL